VPRLLRCRLSLGPRLHLLGHRPLDSTACWGLVRNGFRACGERSRRRSGRYGLLRRLDSCLGRGRWRWRRRRERHRSRWGRRRFGIWLRRRLWIGDWRRGPCAVCRARRQGFRRSEREAEDREEQDCPQPNPAQAAMGCNVLDRTHARCPPSFRPDGGPCAPPPGALHARTAVLASRRPEGQFDAGET
jgi:hypothetical protein